MTIRLSVSYTMQTSYFHFHTMEEAEAARVEMVKAWDEYNRHYNSVDTTFELDSVGGKANIKLLEVREIRVLDMEAWNDHHKESLEKEREVALDAEVKRLKRLKAEGLINEALVAPPVESTANETF